jgi:hypothetical protein
MASVMKLKFKVQPYQTAAVEADLPIQNTFSRKARFNRRVSINAALRQAKQELDRLKVADLPHD